MLQNKNVEEVNLSRNLINLRVIEMVQGTLKKIRELKIKLEEPGRAKYIKDHEHDHLYARDKQIEIVKEKQQLKQLESQINKRRQTQDKVEDKYRRIFEQLH